MAAELPGEIVAEIRNLSGFLTISEIAQRLHLPKGTVSRIVSGVRHGRADNLPCYANLAVAGAVEFPRHTPQEPTPDLEIFDDAYVPQPCKPTDIPPGTRARVEVYRRRVALKQEIHHLADATIDGHTSAVLDRPEARGPNSPKQGRAA